MSEITKINVGGTEYDIKDASVPDIQYSSTDIGVGAPLTTGTFYFVYEE